MDELTLLHRQVHPTFVQDNKISSQVFENATVIESQISSSVFIPTKNHQGQLSVYNGNKFSPEESFKHYTQTHVSVGVVAVSKGECDSIGLGCVDDNNPFDGHATIDFNPLAGNAIKVKAQLLKAFATKRGWQHRSS